MMNINKEITHIKDGGYCLNLPEGVQARGMQKNLHMDSKFPEGYFEWLDKRMKYDHKGGTVLDYMIACDIQRIADSAEQQVAMLRTIDKKLAKLNKLMEDIMAEEESEDENVADNSDSIMNHEV